MKTNNYFLLIYAIVLLVNVGQAQDAGNQIFDNTVLHEIRFEFEQSNYWNTLVNNFETTPEGSSVPYLMGKVTIDGEAVDSVGIRFKGFTSYSYESDKKPIKIDFNEFVSGKRYDGLKKLNLNNSTGDASMQRDVICYELLRNTGVKAPRTSYSKVFFNGEYWGLYQNIEQVDKTFLARNFANGKGNLFKNKGWSHLEWNGSVPSSYHPPFELKTNEEGDDWSGFINLMDVLNNSSDENFPEAIEEVFNVDLFLKTLAVDVATNNWDSYLEHGRNWYIYEDTTTGIFNWIPWDYNFSLGGGSLDDSDDNECFVLADFRGYTNGTTTVDFYNTGFVFGTATYLWDFGDSMTSTEENPTHTYAQAGTYNVCFTATRNSNCFEQICKNVTTTENQECPSSTDGSNPHPVNIAVLSVIEWMPSCCELWGEDCENLYDEITGQASGFGATNFTINQQENEWVLIARLLNVPEFNNRYYTFFCDLLNYQMTEDHLFNLIDYNKNLIRDAIEEDPNFLFSFDEFLTDISAESDTVGIKAILSQRIDSLRTDLATLISCPSYMSNIPWNDVVINEFIAATDSTTSITDPAGEIEDWIELYNNTAAEIDLTGVYLSDNRNELQKWQFPTGTSIPADGYLIVWADKDEDQQGLHASFKLNKSGEQLVLSNSTGTMIDSLSFGGQTANIASARRPNGTGDFVLQLPTHNFNNEQTSGTFDLSKKLNVSFYPNPASDYLEVNIQNDAFANYQVSIYTIAGQLMLKQQQNSSSFRLGLNNWHNGFYLLKIVDEKGYTNTNKFIIR